LTGTEKPTTDLTPFKKKKGLREDRKGTGRIEKKNWSRVGGRKKKGAERIIGSYQKSTRKTYLTDTAPGRPKKKEPGKRTKKTVRVPVRKKRPKESSSSGEDHISVGEEVLKFRRKETAPTLKKKRRPSGGKKKMRLCYFKSLDRPKEKTHLTLEGPNVAKEKRGKIVLSDRGFGGRLPTGGEASSSRRRETIRQKGPASASRRETFGRKKLSIATSMS